MIHDWHKYFHLKFHTSYTISFSARCLIISVSTRLFFNTPLVPLSLDWTNMRKQTLGKAEIKSRKKKKKKKGSKIHRTGWRSGFVVRHGKYIGQKFEIPIFNALIRPFKYLYHSSCLSIGGKEERTFKYGKRVRYIFFLLLFSG